MLWTVPSAILLKPADVAPWAGILRGTMDPVDVEMLADWEHCSGAVAMKRLADGNGLQTQWQVSVGNKFGCGTWVDMPPNWSNATEEAYQSGKNIVTVDEGMGRWSVDPKRLVQTNTYTKTERAIRRILVDVEGTDSQA